MTRTPPPAPLAVTETDEIADLLADLMPHVDRGRPTAAPPAPPSVESRPLDQVLAEANWHNEPPSAVPVRAAVCDGQPFEGPFPAPIGVLALGEFLNLVNWRNQPGEVKPLPLLGKEPGHEWTVEAVLAQFGWE
jgi:hypothetical protein